jgi:serine/threonine protein kinase
MWAIGMMLLDILGGGLRREIKEKDEKLALARCTDLELWARYLGKKPTKRIPEPWIAVMSLLRGLLAEAPHLRLSAASALQHSFLA